MYCIKPKIVRAVDGVYRQVPCQKCVACQRRYQMAWTVRLAIELHHASSAYMVTLTYDDDNLPDPTKLPYYDKSGNKSYYECCFNKKQVQLWLKRLKKGLYGVKHFLVAEYGDITLRPHYHCILFNFPGTRNELIDRLIQTWRFCDPRHFLIPDYVESVGMGSIKYVTGYALKRHDYPPNWEKPWSLMSDKLGLAYLTPEIIKYHKKTLSNFVMVDGVKYTIPRYLYDKLFDEHEKKELTVLNRCYVRNTNRITDQRNLKVFGWYFSFVKSHQFINDPDLGVIDRVDDYLMPVDQNGKPVKVNIRDSFYQIATDSMTRRLLAIKNKKRIL